VGTIRGRNLFQGIVGNTALIIGGKLGNKRGEIAGIKKGTESTLGDEGG